MDREKEVDESWKDAAKKVDDILAKASQGSKDEDSIVVSKDIKDSLKKEKDACGCGDDHSHEEHPQAPEVDFLNYVTSLGFQAMIFLGVIPNPMTNQTDKNVEQAKFLIDTLSMIKEKTKGNLNEQEENMMNASVYELQMKYVEVIKEDSKDD